MAASPAPRTPIRLPTMLALVSAVPVVVGVSLTGWLSLRSSENLVEGLVADLQLEVAAGAADALEDTLDPPHLVNASNVDLLSAGVLTPDDFDQLQHHFLNQLRHFGTAGYVQLGRADGHFVGVERAADGFRVERTDPELRGKDVWRLDASGVRSGDPVGHVAGYNATKRPWYQAAVAAGGPTWSPIYQFSSRESVRLGVTAVQPWFGSERVVHGVAGTDIVLAHLGKLLDSPRLRDGGRVFAVERDGKLVAHNTIDPPFLVDADQKAMRLAASESGDPVTVAAMAALEALPGGLAGLAEPRDVTAPLAGDVAFVHAVPFEDGRGIDWVLVVAQPRIDFLPEIRRNLISTAVLSAGSLLGALVLGVLVARRVAAPILRLADAASALAEGRSDRPLPTPRTTELAVLTDAFSRMRARIQEQQDALERVAAEAVEAKETAEAASRAKSAFLANMSHELRTPLNAILGYAELLAEDTTISGQGRADLERIRVAGGHLLGLISDVLDLSRIEAGHLDLQIVRADASQVARDAAQTTRSLIERGGNELVLDLPSEPLWVTTDPEKLRQCLINLLGNASKFTEGGRIDLAVRSATDRVVFEVRDTGIGIAPEQLPRLFAPFAQIDPSSTRRRDGAGLGLAITREFVRALGGDVRVHSEVGRGSRFALILPLSGPERRTAQPAPPRVQS